MATTHHVIKRNGKKEKLSFDKVHQRVLALSSDLDKVDSYKVAQKVISGLFDGISTNKIDELLAETSALLNDEHPQYGLLGGRLAVSSIHKETSSSFYQTMKSLYKEGSLSDLFIDKVKKYQKDLEKIVDYDRDFSFDFFAIKTLSGKSNRPGYLMRVDNKIVERPQHLFMRVALAVADDNIKAIQELYDLISQGFYTHATPTLFNAGHKNNNYASCFLVQMESDSINGIFNTAKEAGLISKHSGGIGIHVSNLRASGSKIKGNNGFSNGIVPWMKIFNEVACSVNQCFTPDSLVYTTEGIKKSKDIQLGDRVFGHDGLDYEVTHQLSSYYKGEMLKIRLNKSMEDIEVTPEHPFYVLKDVPREISYSSVIKSLDSKRSSFEWCDAKLLTDKDMAVFPIPTFEKDIEDFSEADCRFYGMMIGDGHITEKTNECGLTLSPETNDLEFVRNYLKVYNINTWETISEEKKCIMIRWSNSPHFKIKRSMLYDENKEKIVLPRFLHLPKNKILQIIKGILETDGFIGKTLGSEITLEMTSKNIVESVRYMVLRLGALTSGYLRTSRDGHVSKYGDFIEGKKQAYVLRIPRIKEICDLFEIEESTKFKFLKYNNYLLTRIDTISSFEYEGEVFDYNVKTSESYITSNGGLVHNGGKRAGSIAMYLEPWHADVEAFLEMAKVQGPESVRARELFLAMWIPDLFFKRCEADESWSLLCPDECPGLQDVYGEEFEELYAKYEKQGKARKVVKARELLAKMADTQIEHGMPYMLSKDSANKKSNQKNIGVIKSSNLCAEILEVSTDKETAVCNLASVALSKFVKPQKKEFDFKKLEKVVRVATRNLNNVIDRTFYPTEKCQVSNSKHRPIGIGVQGLADVFYQLDLPFDSEEALKLDREIFETMYFAFLTESMELAKISGPYESFKGSPASEGILQFDMWDVVPSDRHDWKQLKENIKEHGLRNSLGIALMPTASTASIFGNVEAFEPQKGNIYKREVLSGEFLIVNKHLVKALEKVNLWNVNIKNRILSDRGSVQNIAEIPAEIKAVYKTAYEIKQRAIMDHAAARGAFVDQSQSMNLFFENIKMGSLTSAMMYGWKIGLKTISYYVRSKSASTSARVGEVAESNARQANIDAVACSIDNKEECEVCSS